MSLSELSSVDPQTLYYSGTFKNLETGETHTYPVIVTVTVNSWEAWSRFDEFNVWVSFMMDETGTTTALGVRVVGGEANLDNAVIMRRMCDWMKAKSYTEEFMQQNPESLKLRNGHGLNYGIYPFGSDRWECVDFTPGDRREQQTSEIARKLHDVSAVYDWVYAAFLAETSERTQEILDYSRTLKHELTMTGDAYAEEEDWEEYEEADYDEYGDEDSDPDA